MFQQESTSEFSVGIAEPSDELEVSSFPPSKRRKEAEAPADVSSTYPEQVAGCLVTARPCL